MKNVFLDFSIILPFVVVMETASANYFPIEYTWPQPDGIGSPITLSYSYSNLLDGSILDFNTNEPISGANLRGAFEAALRDYTEILPIHFLEVSDTGPLPETGEYNPEGFADIRVGQVLQIEDANAYAYYPFDNSSGLAGDIIFNAERFGNNWTLSIFYGVAQHELGHSLGMGHALPGDPPLKQPKNLLKSTDYSGPHYPLNQGMITTLQDAYGARSGSVTPLPVPLPAAFLLLLTGIGSIGLTSIHCRLRRSFLNFYAITILFNMRKKDDYI